MIPEFKKLSQNENDLLLKAPALVSLLAVSGDDQISNAEKSEAIRMAHLRTYTADPILRDFYKEVDQHFKHYFQAAVKKYTPFDDAMRAALKRDIDVLNKVIGKLNKKFAIALHESLNSYGEHVRKANRSFLENFIFPFPIPGMTD